MGGEEDILWSAQIMVAKHESRARNGPIMLAGVLFLSHSEKSSPSVNDP